MTESPPQLIDTHAHLDDERFQIDLPQVIDRAQAAGLICVVTVATTGPTSFASVTLAAQNPLLRATVGIHPNNAAQAGPGDWDQVLALVDRPKVVALGETGPRPPLGLHAVSAAGRFLCARHIELLAPQRAGRWSSTAARPRRTCCACCATISIATGPFTA